MLNRNKLWADKQQLLLVRTGYQLRVNRNFVSLQDHMESPEAHLNNQILSQAQHIICTCWFHSGMQGASFLGKKHSLWPVCLHCAELMLCWAQETSSPPDGCSLYCYTPPSGSPHRSPSVSATSGEQRRTASLPGRSPSTASVPGRRPAPRGNLSFLSSAGLCYCSLLCCTQHRGSGWSPAVASPSKQDTKNIFSLIFSLLLLCLNHIARPLYILWVWIQAAS